MQNIPQTEPLVYPPDEPHYYQPAAITERLDRFPPIAAIEHARQSIDPRWIRITVAAETLIGLAIVFWFIRESLWIVVRLNSDIVAVSAALVCAAVIYLVFGVRR